MTTTRKRPDKYRAPRPPIPKALRKRAVARAGNRCQVPGCDARVGLHDVHHIDGNREHNVLRNLVVICPNHHRLERQGEYPPWKLRWYNLRSPIVLPLVPLLDLFRRKAREPVEKVLDAATGQRRLRSFLFLFLLLAGCLVVAVVAVVWR